MHVSVIVNVYNGAGMLPSALQSIANQTLPGFELIVVDDGSTDDISAVVDKFRTLLPQVVYHRKPHTGLADSRNYAVALSTGSHIAYLDADDAWAPRYLEAMLQAMQTSGAEVMQCNGWKVDDRDGTGLGAFFDRPVTIVGNGALSADAFFDYFIMSGPSSSVVTRSALSRVGPYDLRYGISHDRHWLMRAMLAGVHCARLMEPLVLYRCHGGNLSSRTEEVFREWIETYRDFAPQFATAPRFERRSRALFRRLAINVIEKGQAGPLLEASIAVLGGDTVLSALLNLSKLGMGPVIRGLKSLRSLGKWARRRPPADLLGLRRRLFVLQTPPGAATQATGPAPGGRVGELNS